ncbi:MAG TPA: DUF1800 domain-containing protein [Gemmatimonadaceae bacterium]|nr:DUF1800 domain-containing protein [Gemmatimonadaceae bacterium]
MKRRNSLLIVGALGFLFGATLPCTSTAQSTARPAAPAARLDHRELAADQQVIHVLNRLAFGARPGDVQKVRAMGVDKWIDQQLHPEQIDDQSLEQFLNHYNILREDQGQLLQEYAMAQRDRRQISRDAGDTAQGGGVSREDQMALQQVQLKRRQVAGALQSSRVARAVISNRQLDEVMTDFWLNHFNIFIQKGPPQAYYLAKYERDVIRPHSLGKFRDLLEAVAKSPAMLFYLDNARSMADSTRPRLANFDRRQRPAGRVFARRGAQRGQIGQMNPQQSQQIRQRLNQLQNGGLNENYGRELLELHTLGVDGGYTQQDVINVARALTGWTINQPAQGGGFIFRPMMHDAGEKTVLGHKLTAGRGIEDGEDVLDIVSRHPSTAHYISEKLVRHFVSDNPPQALVDQAAAVFTRTDGDIREVLRTIITSNEFFSQQAFRSKVKSPFEVVASAMRAMGAQADSTPRTAQVIAFLGQPIYGHQAPNGYPDTGDAWMNAGAILNRINFGMAVAANRIPGARINAVPGLDTLGSAPRAKQVDAVVALMLGGSASPDTRAVLMSGENPLLANGAASAAAMEMAAQPASEEMMPQQQTQPNARNAAQNRRPQQGQQGQQRPQGNPLAGRNGAPMPQLNGIAQVVGLALGSPEFQRH